jgi:hypothetical protein
MLRIFEAWFLGLYLHNFVRLEQNFEVQSLFKLNRKGLILDLLLKDLDQLNLKNA